MSAEPAGEDACRIETIQPGLLICYNILMAKKTKIIVGNWKMGPQTLEEARTIFETIELGLPKTNKKVKVVICPPAIYLSQFAGYEKRRTILGAQNAFTENDGAYTGEVSMAMIKNIGAKYVIVGHSERRKLGETDETINKKIRLALETEVTPIFCIGEEVRDEEGGYLALLKNQLEKGLAGVSKNQLADVVVAYEPIFAIGAQSAMAAADVHETILFIKKALVDIYNMKTMAEVPVLYGGSVKPENAKSIMADGTADGLLIGRQSLDADNFLAIINLAQEI